MKKNFLAFAILFFALTANFSAQVKLSVYSEISIVTAGPGTELYEAFGHAAIRIKDPLLQLDLIYNYGIFDFNAPNFYTNFTKGKLLYKLGRYQFKYFLASYKNDKRWVKEQVLQLTQQEKQAFFIYLEKNALPQNASYYYDPYFNNCATKLRDLTKEILANKVVFKSDIPQNQDTFRELMNQEIHWNTWGNFGINLALGSKLDKKTTLEDKMYLPDYVYRIFKNSVLFVENQPQKLVKKESILLDFKEQKPRIGFLNPLVIFSIIALLGLIITYKDSQKKQRSKWLDFFLFFTTGILGFVIVFLWFFTNHSTTPNNLNVLWSFAPNLIVSFFVLKNKNKKWLATYCKFLLLLLSFIPVLWLAKIQLFPLAVIPLLILLFVRYYFLSKRLS